MVDSMEIIFWIATAFILYTYAGYPLLIRFLAGKSTSILGDPDKQKKWPNISIIVPVHNEEANVISKLDNLKSLDYPQSKLEIIFVSDGSTDRTNELLESCSDIKLISYSPRKGKPTALNTAVSDACSDILLFTDVRQELDNQAIKFLVSTLEHNNVGAVSGELIHRDPVSHTGRNVGLYWRYEKWIRKAESKFHSTAGVTGALYIIHRNDYSPLLEDTILDDFEVPIHILKKGHRVVFDPRAKIYDEVQEESSAEQKRKIRTLTGNYQSFTRNLWLFLPRFNPIFFQFLSHKVFRLLIPYALIFTIVSSFLLPGLFYQSIFWLQLVFYGLALAAFVWPTLRMNRLINLIVVFVSMNWAVLVALKNVLTQKIEVRWEKT